MWVTHIVCTPCQSPFFWHPSHDVRTLMTTLPLKAAMPYLHFPFFIFPMDWDFFHSALLVIDGDFRNKILLWIQCILALITGREGYAQLWFPWIPKNPSLWIFMPPVSCTLVTSGSPCEPSLLLSCWYVNQWMFCIASNPASSYTNILIILK